MQPILGEIRMFGGNFAPVGWMLCDGQLLAVSSYDALFSLLGTTYGGDGETTFGLPALRGRIPIHSGNSTGPGLSTRPLGQKSGTETVTLTTSQMPSHHHTMQATSNPPDSNNPSGKALATGSRSVNMDHIYAENSNPVPMGSSVTNNGGSQQHNNLMPYLVVNYIIAVDGVYPSED